MNTYIFDVKGMTCQHCVKSVTNAVSNVSGVTQVDVSLAEGKVQVETAREINSQDIAHAIEEQGFTVVNS